MPDKRSDSSIPYSLTVKKGIPFPNIFYCKKEEKMSKPSRRGNGEGCRKGEMMKVNFENENLNKCSTAKRFFIRVKTLGNPTDSQPLYHRLANFFSITLQISMTLSSRFRKVGGDCTFFAFSRAE